MQRSRQQLSSYKIEDNPNYHNLLYTILVLNNLSKKNSTAFEKDQDKPE
jgi:hypothetical protein